MERGGLGTIADTKKIKDGKEVKRKSKSYGKNSDEVVLLKGMSSADHVEDEGKSRRKLSKGKGTEEKNSSMSLARSSDGKMPIDDGVVEEMDSVGKGQSTLKRKRSKDDGEKRLSNSIPRARKAVEVKESSSKLKRKSSKSTSKDVDEDNVRGMQCTPQETIVNAKNNEGEKKVQKKSNSDRKESDGEACVDDASEFQINKDNVNNVKGQPKMRKKRLKSEGKEKESNSVSNAKKTKGVSEKSSNKTAKRVSFAENVEVLNAGETSAVVRGKRFTPEEDEIVKTAVLDYISSHNLGENGLDMVLYCREHPEVKGCWKDITACIPHRPLQSVYYRAHILFERDTNGKWTPEEGDIVRNFYKEHGPKWKKLAQLLGKQRIHVKDHWRRINNVNQKKGKWEQDEYQSLFDLVNMDLQAKVCLKKKHSKYGMLRDDIPWTAISRKLETRNQDICCMKWYQQLASPLVVEGKWCDSDDYRLVKALYDLDAVCMEDVDWDELIEHRSGDICRQRWMQMVKHLGEHNKKAFADQVRVLTERYCPNLLETRVAFDNLPVSP